MTKRKTADRYSAFHLDETNDGTVQVPIPVFYNEGIDVEDKELYFVYLLRETNILTNMLLAILHYKEYTGQCWPRIVVYSAKSRFSKYALRFGEETAMKSDARFRIMDAIYMSLYGPIPDLHGNNRIPTIFDGKRKIVKNPKKLSIPSHKKRRTERTRL